MNPKAPLLPEATFKPLSDNRLEAMIDHALTHRQNPVPGSAQIISLANWKQKLTFGSTMAAMAASIMLAFLFTPQYTTTVATGTNVPTLASQSADLSDMLFFESLES